MEESTSDQLNDEEMMGMLFIAGIIIHAIFELSEHAPAFCHGHVPAIKSIALRHQRHTSQAKQNEMESSKGENICPPNSETTHTGLTWA